MSNRAVLFGSIGTIVETSDIQRFAFNEAFREAGLDWNWTPKLYSSMLDRSGGVNRIEQYAEAQSQTVNAGMIHQRKTEIFNKIIVDQGLSPREGVQEVIERAKATETLLGLASTTSVRNVDAIFRALQGAISPADFAFVGHRDLVEHGKPEPDIYLKAIADLDLAPSRVVAIENSGISLKAAKAAGIDTIGFPGHYTAEQSYEDAIVVTDRLSWEIIEQALHLPLEVPA